MDGSSIASAKPARKAISKTRRFEIFKRDGFRCQYCGATPPNALLQIDHIRAVVRGGSNYDENLVTACDTCNAGKAARPITDVPRSLADQAKDTKERERQIIGYENIMRGRRERLEREGWEVAETFMRFYGDDSILKTSLRSMKYFVDKLGLAEVMDSLDLACARKPYSKSQCFKYFCGICWKKIKRTQQGASE